MRSRILSHYEIVEKIGEGGMGEVYLARDTVLQRTVAVKVLPPDKRADPERQRRFLREARAASVLSHPGIITVYDVVSEGGNDHIVMEYVQGVPLNRWIPAGGLPPAKAVAYALQIAEAVAAAHAAGVIHRDLKPGNVMVTPDERIKVLDFGLAKRNPWLMPGADGTFTALTQAGAVMGTVEYMAPEQALGKPADGRCDVFSLGVMLYELFTSRRPFGGVNPVAVAEQVINAEPPPVESVRPDLPPALGAIVRTAMAKEPDSRYSTMAQMATALGQMAEELDSFTPSPAPSSRRPISEPASFPTPTLPTRAAAESRNEGRMECAKCGADMADVAKFCLECGTPAGIACAECGAHCCARDARFCGECGSKLRTRPVGSSDRRQLTVVFVDLVGSSALSEKLDPEELHVLLQTYRAACVEPVQRYDGHVAQYPGDGILAYFGYPIAHEDASVRAVRSGLEIIEAVEGIRLHEHRLQVRVGVHSGLVVIGDVGDPQRGEQLALGEAPNIAARLQAAADVDSMLISDATRQLLAGQFALEDGGSRTLKGISRPLRVHRVLGHSGASSRFAARATAGLAPFVGREYEIASIRRAWTETLAGAGHTILLRGEAGIGKSRLLGATRDSSRVRLHEVFEVECSPYDANRALHPIAQMLERRLGLQDETAAIGKLELLEHFTAGRGTPLEEALPLLAELLSIPTGERYPTLDLPPPRRRQRTLEVLADLLLHCPDGSPVLLLIEDLHWADPSTLELVEALVARQTSAPLFMLCTARPELPVSWPPAPHWREIAVAALPKDDARALIAGVTRGKPLPEEVTRQILARTGGVPLFVEAVTQTILETGALRELEDHYELLRPLPADLIPATVHDSLMARIDQLGPDKPIAQLASAIGRTFRIDLLSHVADMSVRDLWRAIDHLVELDLIAPSGMDDQGTYTFKHTLIQDAAYKSLLRSTRQEVHGRIADALVHRFPGVRESDPALLARHFEGAGQVEEAIECWMQAGFQAQHASAEQECIANLRKALALLETLPEDDPQRLEKETATHLALAPALMATRGWGSREVEAVCQRARVLCERTHNEEGLFTVLWGLWTVLFVRGDHASALGAARALLEMALAGDNRVLLVGAHMAVGDTHYFRGEFRDALEHAERGLAFFDLELERELVRKLQIPLLAVCSFIANQSLLFMGRPEEARRHHDRLVDLVAALANPTCTAVGLGVALYSLYELRDLNRIEQLSQEAYAVSEEEGFVFWATFMQVYRGWVWCMRGDPESGIPEMYAGLEGFLRTQSLIAVPQMWLMIAEGHQAAREFDEAHKAIANGLRLVEDNHERIYKSHLHRVRGEIEIEEGDAEQGEATLRCAIEIAVRQDACYIQLRAALPLARLLVAQGRSMEAHELLRPLHEAFTEGHDLAELIDARELLEAVDA